MATIVEIHGSREHSGSGITLKYAIFGTNDDNEALQLAVATAPMAYATPFKSYPRDPNGIKIDPAGYQLWHVDVSYKDPSGGDEPQDGNEDDDGDVDEWAFDTTGGKTKIFLAKDQTQYDSHARKGPNVWGQINVTEDRKVHGVDIVIPEMAITYTKIWEAHLLTTDYVKLVARMTGRTNSAPYREFAKGELLFLGARGKGKAKEKGKKKNTATIEYTFAASENLEKDFDNFPKVKKDGWQYLWSYGQTDDAEGFTAPRPIAIYVATTYDEGDFSQLQIF